MRMNLRKDVLLAPYTTLGVGGTADYFVELDTLEALEEVLVWANAHNQSVTVLGSGSNVLISDRGIRGLVIRLLFHDVVYTKSNTETYVTVGAGALLDDVIQELVRDGLWGLENLSAIPGTVGAVPIQNVGAYGVEAKDIVHQVTIYDPHHKKIRIIDNKDCVFAYRDSIFKHDGGKAYIIVSVTFRVSTVPQPKLSYRDLALHFKDVSSPTLFDIRNAVIHIRSTKFPDWKCVGTAGSFFKNPIITIDHYTQLRQQYPELSGYPTEDGRMKISLGWILDQVCHMRGYREGTVGLYEHQALVLVCDKNTSASDIQIFSQKILDRVYAMTNINAEREVTMLE